MTIFFDFYGVRVRVLSRAYVALLEDLKLDFGYFLSGPVQPDIDMVLVRGNAVSNVNVRAPYVFSTRMCRVYGLSDPRLCDYGGGLKVFSRVRKSGRRFVVAGEDPVQVYEAAYIAILSSVGEELDFRGYHRIHALAFSRNKQTVLLPLPPGGGKSSTAYLMLKDPTYRVFSDEIPLLCQGKLHPFPIRIGILPAVAGTLSLDQAQARRFQRKIFKEKLLIPVPGEKVASSAPIDLVLLPKRSFLEKLAVVWSVVWGLGTPQMSEYMLRGNSFFRLVRIAASRLRAAVSLLRNSDMLSFETPSDPKLIKSRLDDLI